MQKSTRLWRLLLGGAALAAVALVAGCGGGSASTETSASPAASPSAAAGAPPALVEAQQAVQGGLDALDADLSAAARELAGTGIKGAAATAILEGLVTAHPEVADFYTQDVAGKIVAIQPAKYKSFVGTQGMPKDDANHLYEAREPILSDTVTAEEGFLAAALVHPVIKDDGTMIGAVAAFLDTDTFLGSFIDPIEKPADLDKIWVMDTKGNDLYDPDKNHSGRNILTDKHFKPYPDLLALATEIAGLPSGSGSYTSPPSDTNDEPITKEAWWSSVGLYGTQWRVIAALVAAEK